MQVEVVPTPVPDADEVVVLVMAAGVNYNGVWAGLGKPISPFDVHKAEYHIAGSDAAGIVWAVGSKVKRWKVGDEVVVHCNQDDGDDEECNGGDPMFSPSQRIWGYETPDGSFAQFCQGAGPPADAARQAPDLGRERLLHADARHRLSHAVRPSPAHPAARPQRAGLGRLGRPRLDGGAADAPRPAPMRSASSPTRAKRDFVMSLGAKGVINRNDFDCWGQLPDVDDAAGYDDYMKRCREFGKAIWDITGKGNDVDFVFEHPGEQTFPVSCFVVKRGGMVVFCAGTTGYNLTFDARFVWMRQKRIQGSHFANLLQASQANHLVVERRIDPCMSRGVRLGRHSRAPIPRCGRTSTSPGNMAVLVQAKRPGLRTLEDASKAEIAVDAVPWTQRGWRPRRCADLLGCVPPALDAADAVLARAQASARAASRPAARSMPQLLEREQHAAHGFAWLATYVAALRADAATGPSGWTRRASSASASS